MPRDLLAQAPSGPRDLLAQQPQPSAPGIYDYLAAGPGGGLVQGATEGGQEMMRLPMHALSSISDLGGLAPNPVSETLRSGTKAIDDWVAKQRENYQAARDKFANPASKAWNVAGSAVPAMAAGSLVEAPAAAQTMLGNVWRGVVQGAKTGALSGLVSPSGNGDNYWGEKATQAGTGAAMGALTGGATNAMAPTAPPTPGAPDFKAQAQQMYDTAHNAGVIVKKDSFKGFVDDLKQDLADKGIDEGMHPQAMAALRYLDNKTGDNITLKGLDLARQNIGRAVGSQDASNRFFGKIMQNKLDDYMESLSSKPGDIIAGDAKTATDALSQARDLWMTYKKSALIDDLIDGAKNRSNFTASGFENGLRTEFRALAQNNAKMRTFTPDEREAIQTIVRGGPVDNFFRGIGRFAVRGPVSGMVAGAADRVIPGAGMAVAGVGEGARHMAQKGTMQNIDALRSLVQGQRAPIPFSPPPGGNLASDPAAILRLLQSGLIGPMVGSLSQQPAQIAP